LLYRPQALAHAAAARCVAELILNAPGMVGSLELFFNVTGLLHSVSAGLIDLFNLPLTGLSSKSLTAFVAGIWMGWASLLRHMSGWTLTSVAGFSLSVARILRRAHGQGNIGGGGGGGARPGGSRSTERALLQQKLAASLVDDPDSEHSASSSSRGSGGYFLGISQGILGLVTRPVSGALELVASTSQGILHFAGIKERCCAVRDGRLGDLVPDGKPPWSRCWHGRVRALLEAHSAAWPRPLVYVTHAEVQAVTVEVGLLSTSDNVVAWPLKRPLLVVTTTHLVVLDSGGCFFSSLLPLKGLMVKEDTAGRSAVFGASKGTAWDEQHRRIQVWQEQPVNIFVHVGTKAWQVLMPSLRNAVLSMNSVYELLV